jgi:hypothetical protein
LRGVPINPDLSSLLLVPDNSSCCLWLQTQVPIQYPVRDFATAGLGLQVPINTDLSSLLLVPDNSSCCLPVHALYRSQSSILLGISQAGSGWGKVPINSDLSACCWSLITAAVACLGARYTRVPIQYPFRFRNSGARVGKVPINTDLSSLLLIPNSNCCLPGCTLYTGPNQYPVRDFATAGLRLGAGPNQY